jgi:hypothetical protein
VGVLLRSLPFLFDLVDLDLGEKATSLGLPGPQALGLGAVLVLSAAGVVRGTSECGLCLARRFQGPLARLL